MVSARDVDSLIEQTRPPVARQRARRRAEVPPLIAQWRQEESAQRGGWWSRWVRSQVAGYRLELVLGYLAVMYFGGSAIAAGIPIFSFTTPAGWTPIWGSAVIVGGMIAAAGALRAGEEPQTKSVRIFHYIELIGTILLVLTLGAYSVILQLIGYGVLPYVQTAATGLTTELANLGRIAGGAGFAALAIRPAVRMVWLIFHPGKRTENTNASVGTKVETVDTGETRIRS